MTYLLNLEPPGNPCPNIRTWGTPEQQSVLLADRCRDRSFFINAIAAQVVPRTAQLGFQVTTLEVSSVIPIH
jgi:hypothetical protein